MANVKGELNERSFSFLTSHMFPHRCCFYCYYCSCHCYSASVAATLPAGGGVGSTDVGTTGAVPAGATVLVCHFARVTPTCTSL